MSEKKLSQQLNNIKVLNPFVEGLTDEVQQLYKVLDTASATIHEFESSLRDAKAYFPFRRLIRQTDVKINSLAPFPISTHTQEEWFLSWEKDDKTDNFRLFLISEEVGMIVEEDNFGSRWVEIERAVKTKKIFIETDLNTRLEFLKYLHPFMTDFTNHIKSFRCSIEKSIEESIPF